MNGAWHTERNKNIINFIFSMVTVLQLTQAAFSRKLSTFYPNRSCWTRKWQCLSFLIQRKRNGISLLKPSSSKRASRLICFPDLGAVSSYFPWKMFSPWQNLLVAARFDQNPEATYRPETSVTVTWPVLHTQRAIEIQNCPCPTSPGFLITDLGDALQIVLPFLLRGQP